MRDDRVYMRDQATHQVEEIMNFYKNKPTKSLYNGLASLFFNFINIKRRRDNSGWSNDNVDDRY